MADPTLQELHEQINQAIQWSSKPNFQRVCEVLNGMRMEDMLDELWRIKSMGHLNGLWLFVPRAQNVNVVRLQAAIGALLDEPPGNLDTFIQSLPADQQRAIKSVRAAANPPANLGPATWSRFYWGTRLLPTYVPPPKPSTTKGDGANDDDKQAKKVDDDEAHLAADIATALAAAAPRNPMSYTVTVVYRGLDGFKAGDADKTGTEVDVAHEPNVSLQISPDPNNPAAVQAAISLVNLHLKRHWGLINPDIEVSLGAQAGVQAPSGAPGAAVQAQVEMHVTTTISITLGASLAFGPGRKPDDPPDPGAFHFGDKSIDMAFTPFSIGILGHWDPPKK